MKNILTLWAFLFGCCGCAIADCDDYLENMYSVPVKYAESSATPAPQETARWLQSETDRLRREHQVQNLFNEQDPQATLDALDRLIIDDVNRAAAKEVYSQAFSDSDLRMMGFNHSPTDSQLLLTSLRRQLAVCTKLFGETDEPTVVLRLLIKHLEKFAGLPIETRNAVLTKLQSENEPVSGEQGLVAISNALQMFDQALGDDVLVMLWIERQLDHLDGLRAELTGNQDQTIDSKYLTFENNLYKQIVAMTSRLYGDRSAAAIEARINLVEFQGQTEQRIAVLVSVPQVSKQLETIAAEQPELVDYFFSMLVRFATTLEREQAWTDAEKIVNAGLSLAHAAFGKVSEQSAYLDLQLKRLRRMAVMSETARRAFQVASERLAQVRPQLQSIDVDADYLAGTECDRWWQSDVVQNGGLPCLSQTAYQRQSPSKPLKEPPPADDRSTPPGTELSDNLTKWINAYENAFGPSPLIRLRGLEAQALSLEFTGDFTSAIKRYREALICANELSLFQSETATSLRQAIDANLYAISKQHWDERAWANVVRLSNERIQWRSEWLGSLHWATADARRDRDVASLYLTLPRNQVEQLLETEQAIADIYQTADYRYSPQANFGSDSNESVPSEAPELNARQQLVALKLLSSQRLAILKQREPLATMHLLATANLESVLGNLDRAADLLAEAAKVCVRDLGTFHPDFVIVLQSQSRLAFAAGEAELAAARNFERQAIARRIGMVAAAEYPTAAAPYMSLLSIESSDETFNKLQVIVADQFALSLYEAAESTAREMLKLAKELHGEQSLESVVAMSTLASVWAETGDFVQAEEWYAKSLACINARKANSEQAFVGKLQHNLAAVAGRMNRLPEACELLRQAIANTPTDDQLSHGLMQATLGDALRRLNQLEDAKAHLMSSIKSLETAGATDHRAYGSGLCELGLVYSLQGEFNAAKRVLDNAKNFIGDTDRTAIDRFYSLGVMHFKSGDTPTAIVELLKSVRLAISQLDLACAFQTPRQQVAAAIATRECLDALLTVSENSPNVAAQVYECVLAFKSISWQITSDLDEFLAREENASLVQEIRDLQDQISASTGELMDSLLRRDGEVRISTAQAEVASPSATMVEHAHTELRDKMQTLERELAKQLSQFGLNRQTQILSKIQQALPADSVVVDIVPYNQQPWFANNQNESVQTTAFALHHDSTIDRISLGNNHQLAELIAQWHGGNRASSASWEPNGPGSKLREQIWTPIERRLKVAEQVVRICPDGALTSLPFGALPGKAEQTYLIEESRRIILVPSAQSIVNERVPMGSPIAQPGAVELLLIGNLKFGAEVATDNAKPNASIRETLLDLRHWKELDGMGTEVNDLRGIFEDTHPLPEQQYRRLTKTEADKQTVINWLAHARNIHFATHGFYGKVQAIADHQLSDATTTTRDTGNRRMGSMALSSLYPGVRSGIALSNANAASSSEGLLTAFEVSRLNMASTDLVVLSACETAIGEYESGEGQLSMQWAFHVAGAHTVVASLWQVDDQATARLMRRFYKNLWEGNLSKIEALREAQLWMLRDEQARGSLRVVKDQGPEMPLPPYYWAAFVLSGDCR